MSTIPELRKLRNLTEGLTSRAEQANSLRAFVTGELEALQTLWPALQTYRVDDGTTQASRTPLQDGDQWVVPLGELNITISGTSAEDDTLWEIVLLWAQSVELAWNHARNARSNELAPDDRLKLLEGLASVTEQIWAELASEAVLNAACQGIVNTIEGVDRVGIVFNDNAPKSGTVVAAYPDEPVGGKIYLEGYPVYEHLKQTLSPIIIPRVEEASDLLLENQEFLMSLGIKSMLILPLVVQGELIGSLGFDAVRAHRQFSETEVEVLSAIATQIAISLYNAQLYEAMQFRSASQEFANQVLGNLPLRTDLNTLLQTAGQNIGQVLGASRFRIRLDTDISDHVG